MEFLQLRQYGMSVREYASRFEFLLTSSWYFQLHPDEEWKCLKFEEGLRSEIGEALLPLRIREFSRLVNECVLIEDRQKTRNEGQCHLGSSGSKSSDNVQFQQQLYAEPQGNEQQRRQSSGGNNKEAHHSTMSTFRYRNLRHGSGHANRKRNSKGITCFQGGKFSQVASVCQQPSEGISGPSQGANLTQQSYAEPQGNEQQRQQSSRGNHKGARHFTVSTHRYYMRHGRGHANRNCNLKGIVGFQGGKTSQVTSVCKQRPSKGSSGPSQAANLTPHCKRCGKGHLTRHCIIEGVACFKCGKPGHVWRDCMNNKRKRKVN